MGFKSILFRKALLSVNKIDLKRGQALLVPRHDRTKKGCMEHTPRRGNMWNIRPVVFSSYKPQNTAICEHDNTIPLQKMRVGEVFSILFHMKLFVGVKALIHNKNGQILVLREAEYEEGTNKGKWDVPGGRINPEEPVLVGLAREVMEEAGIVINPLEVLGVYETFPTIKGEACHIVRIYYRAEAVASIVDLSDDHDQYEWVDPKSPGDKEFVSDIEELLEKIV